MPSHRTLAQDLGGPRQLATRIDSITKHRAPMVRTNLSIDKTVFEGFSAEAERRKMTLFAFANQSLAAITKISREGGDPEELYRIWRVLSILRQVDVITMPSDFMEYVVEKQHDADSGSTEEKFRELGESIVGLLKMTAESIEDLVPLAKDFGLFIPIKHFSLVSLPNGLVQVDVIGAGRGMETTKCSSEFLKAIVAGYGYVVKEEELHPGTIRLLADRLNP